MFPLLCFSYRFLEERLSFVSLTVQRARTYVMLAGTGLCFLVGVHLMVAHLLTNPKNSDYNRMILPGLPRTGDWRMYENNRAEFPNGLLKLTDQPQVMAVQEGNALPVAEPVTAQVVSPTPPPPSADPVVVQPAPVPPKTEIPSTPPPADSHIALSLPDFLRETVNKAGTWPESFLSSILVTMPSSEYKELEQKNEQALGLTHEEAQSQQQEQQQQQELWKQQLEAHHALQEKERLEWLQQTREHIQEEIALTATPVAAEAAAKPLQVVPRPEFEAMVKSAGFRGRGPLLTKRDTEGVANADGNAEGSVSASAIPESVHLDKSRFKTLIPNHILNPDKESHLEQQQDDPARDIRPPQERDLQQTSLQVGETTMSSSVEEQAIQDTVSTPVIPPKEGAATTTESGPMFIDPMSIILNQVIPLAAGTPPTPAQPDEAILFRNSISSSSTPSGSSSPTVLVPGFNLVGMYLTLFIASQCFLVFLLVTLFLGVLILTEFVLDREDEDYAQLKYLYWGRVIGIATATIVSAVHGSLLSGYVIIDGHSDWIAKAAVGSICIYWVSMTWIMNKMTGPLPY
ncbi:hypothetical protein BGZ83_006563 [Gryganskiella cystojenkinii]|nr:hypothetical protein BGZ83_006563 [Gryganskiella cystojenkinii]